MTRYIALLRGVNESTVMDKLSRAFGVAEPLKHRIAEGLPVYGTCAGLIMIADTLLDTITGQENLGGLDVVAKVSRGLGEAMVGINVDEIPQPHRLSERGW